MSRRQCLPKSVFERLPYPPPAARDGDQYCWDAQAFGLGDMVAPGVSLLQKAANFATSAAKHVAGGMPQASEAEVARRFAICEACEHFDGKACKKCGCPVVREKKFLSKLSWANEKCPVGKWGPEN